MIFYKTRKVKTPERGTDNSAGVDFFIPNFDNEFIKDFAAKNPNVEINNFSIVVEPGERVLIPAGLRYIIPHGSALVAFNKSGVFTKKGLVVGACVGDSDYADEFHISVLNTSKEPVVLKPDDKVIQCVLLPVLLESVQTTQDLEYFEEKIEENNKTAAVRRRGGFGSTGA